MAVSGVKMKEQKRKDMQYTHLLFEVRDSVAWITLNRPEILKVLP